jgi:hypothetical protein
LDALADAYKQAEERHLKEFPGKTATPTHAAFKVTLCFASGGPDLEIVGRIRWKTYKAKLSAVLLNGSYSYTTGDFVGRVASPFFDVRSAEPGPGWELLDAPPASAKNTILAVLSGPDVRKTLVEDMGSAPIRR